MSVRHFLLIGCVFGVGFVVGNIRPKHPNPSSVPPITDVPKSFVITRPSLPSDHPTDQENGKRTIVLRVVPESDPQSHSPECWSISVGFGTQKFTPYFADPSPVVEK